MSTFKKVISLVLCVAMLAGTFTFLGDLIVPSASAAGESNVAKYADLDKEYDKFVYVGIDVIEVANGELTDGYVQPGDWLEYRMTVLSDMYVGGASPHIVYEKDFFDVRVVTSTTPSTSTTFENTDYEGNLKFEDGKFMNRAHPYAAPNVATYHTLTALPATKVATQMGFCGIDSTTYSNWDIVKSEIGINTNAYNYNFPMTKDTWWTNWYVRVKEGLADGDTGKSFSPEAIYKHNLNPSTGKGDTRRLADVKTADTAGTAASAQALSSRYNVVKHVLLDDCEHTFTIGTGEAPVEKKAVTFQKVDGTVIATGEYAEGDTVEVPEVDGLIAWTDSTTGNAVELGESFTMGLKALTYLAVLDSDEFNVTINLTEGTYADDAVLPEGAEVVDGKLIIKAGFGETVDLSTLPLPEKEGFTGAWDPASVKVESTSGANASVKWTRATYSAKFYLDKEAYEGGEASVKDITFVYGNTIPFANVTVDNLKNDEKFVNWIDAETGEPADTTSTTYAENKSFYAAWTNYDSTLTVWGRDYENGGWKALSTFYGDTGSTVAISKLKALVTEENYGYSTVQYVVAGPENTFDTNTAIRTDVTLTKGNKDVYLFTSIEFKVTTQLPICDADGYITEEYSEEVKSVKTDVSSEELTVNAYVPAPKTTYPGYDFVGWEDEEGNVYPAGNIALDAEIATEYTFTAKYEETVYTIEFIVNNDAALKEVILAKETFTIGDTFDVSEMTLVKEAGKAEEDKEEDKDVNDETTGEEEVPETEEKTYVEAILPEIGKENQEQAGGPYRSVDGYKFVGWKVGTQASQFVDFDINDKVVLTPNKIKELTFNTTITVKGFWEGIEYDFVAYYADTIGEDGKPVYKAMDAVKIKTGTNLDAAYAAALEVVKANLPDGRSFMFWKLENGDTKPNTMPAYGVEVYATYVGKSLSLYVDYNYGTEENPVELETSMQQNKQIGRYLFVGVDVENDKIEGEIGSIAQMVRALTITEATHPGTTYELVGWDIYYVENEEDVKDTTKWKSGISDIEGSTIAKYTLIFQAKWMAHKDFLFRVYNTEGALRSAMDKKFNKYFWYMDNPVEKEKAHPLNALPDRLIIIGFIPKFEFENGFAIRIDPLTISKAWLNPGNWGALLKALFNGISTGFGGAL